MAKTNNLTDYLTDLADTIRTKKGTSALINPQDFASEVASIDTAKPETSANVVPSISAQTIYPSAGETFNVVNVSEVTSAIDANIQAGNIKSGISILGVSGTLTSASLYSASVIFTNGGPITYSQTFTPISGYDGFSAINVTVPLQSSTVSPSTSTKELGAGQGYIGFSRVTINAVTSTIDSNIKASNIKKDVTILGVTGTVEAAGVNGVTTLLNSTSPKQLKNVFTNQ